MSNAPTSTYLVGIVDGKIICIANLSASTKASIAHIGEMGMSVKKAYWGLGVGTHLLNELIAFAKGTGILEVIHLEVKTDNDRAIALYKKMGFQEIGRFPKRMKINGQYCDTILMNLYL